MFNLTGFECETILSSLNPELHFYPTKVIDARRAVNRQPGDHVGTRRADTPEHQENSIKTINLVGIKELEQPQKLIQRCFL